MRWLFSQSPTLAKLKTRHDEDSGEENIFDFAWELDRYWTLYNQQTPTPTVDHPIGASFLSDPITCDCRRTSWKLSSLIGNPGLSIG